MRARKLKLNLKKINGLLPTIVQDSTTGQVLILAYMNREALRKTITTKRVWFYSRSKKRLWMKGEESRNSLSVISYQFDCDKDTLLIRVNPTGPTCHTGRVSCFGEVAKSEDAMADLYKVIQGRKNARPKGSYTASLFTAGIDRICAKNAQEAGEILKAARKETKKRLIEESVDLIYHLFVLLAEKGIGYRGVSQEIAKRKEPR